MSGSESAGVAMMKPANLGQRDHIAHLGRLHRTRIRTVVVQRLVCSRRVVVGRVAPEDPHEVPFTENDDVVEALPPDRPDQALAERILPRRAWSRDDLLDAHRLDAPGKAVVEDAVAVTQQETRCGFVGKGLDDLQGGPLSGGRGP